MQSSQSTSAPRARRPWLTQLRCKLGRVALAPALGAASATALVCWAALIWGPGSESQSQRDNPVPSRVLAPAQPAVPQLAPRSTAPGLDSAAAESSAQSERPAAWLALDSDDVGARIQALRAAREHGDVALLPRLLELELERDPDTAPTVIGVATELAQLADPQLRANTAKRLGEWLRSESQRAGTDARANVSLLVEALGRLDAPEAGMALIEALDTESLPVHVASLAVHGLARRGDPRARSAVERFRARLADAPQTDDAFALELQAEAEQTAERALATLAR